MKPEAGMIVALALLTATSSVVASRQCPPQTPESEARDVVSAISVNAEHIPKGTLNLRFKFDPSASKEERVMWQKIVAELFFAKYATRIHIQLGKKKDHKVVRADDLESIHAALQHAADNGVEIAFYNMPAKGEYRLVPAV